MLVYWRGLRVIKALTYHQVIVEKTLDLHDWTNSTSCIQIVRGVVVAMVSFSMGLMEGHGVKSGGVVEVDG